MIFIIGLILASVFLFILWVQSLAQEQVLESSDTERQIQSNKTQIAKDKTDEEIAIAKKKNAGLQAEAEENRLLADISESQARTVHNNNAAQNGVDGETYRAQVLGQGAFNAEKERMKLESDLRILEDQRMKINQIEAGDLHERTKAKRLKELISENQEPAKEPAQEKKGAKNERKR